MDTNDRLALALADAQRRYLRAVQFDRSSRTPASAEEWRVARDSLSRIEREVLAALDTSRRGAPAPDGPGLTTADADTLARITAWQRSVPEAPPG